MKQIIQIVFSRKEIEEIVKDHVQSFIPDAAKVYMKADDDWHEFPTYQKEKDCIMIEFDRKDVEKEMEKMTEKVDDGEERPWHAQDPSGEMEY